MQLKNNKSRFKSRFFKQLLLLHIYISIILSKATVFIVAAVLPHHHFIFLIFVITLTILCSKDVILVPHPKQNASKHNDYALSYKSNRSTDLKMWGSVPAEHHLKYLLPAAARHKITSLDQTCKCTKAIFTCTH